MISKDMYVYTAAVIQLGDWIAFLEGCEDYEEACYEVETGETKEQSIPTAMAEHFRFQLEAVMEAIPCANENVMN